MKPNLSRLGAIALLVLTVAVAHAQTDPTPPPAPPPAPTPPDAFYYNFGGYNPSDPEAQLEAYDKRIVEAEHALELANTYRDTLARSGKATAAQSTAAAKQVSERTWALDALKKTRYRVERAAFLQKTVDVKFENATVAQAAQALSEASGRKITADSAIPETTRLTVEARHVRLATVLESVARQAGLIIEPENLDGSGVEVGVTLLAPPLLRVNNTEQRFAPVMSPWSAKWGNALGGRDLYGLSPFVMNREAINDEAINDMVTKAMAEANRYRKLYTIAPGVSFFGKRTTLAGGTQVAVTTGKDGATTITLTEPGKNEKGEAGVFRSVHVLQNGTFVRQSRTWQKKP